MLFPTIAKVWKNTIIGQIVNTILCKFKDIIAGLANLVQDFLFELIGKVVNIPFCAAQQFTNALVNNVASAIDKALGPVLDQISNPLGGVGKIAGSIFEAIDFVLGFVSVSSYRWGSSVGTGHRCSSPTIPGEDLHPPEACPWLDPRRWVRH